MSFESRRCWILSLLSLAVLCGCGAAGGSVDQDPLTLQLGKNATTLQQAGWGVAGRSVSAGLAFGPARQLSQITEVVYTGRIDATTVPRINAVLRHPDAGYAAARALMNRVSPVGSEIRSTTIPQAATRGSSTAIRAFVQDWDAYVAALSHGYAATIQKGDAVLSTERPTLAFLRQSRRAILARDRTAFLAARQTYIATLKRIAASPVHASAGAPSSFPGETAAFNRLLHDANTSDDVHRLVAAVIHDFPGSLFAKGFSQWKAE
jgi:hypothetical protein